MYKNVNKFIAIMIVKQRERLKLIAINFKCMYVSDIAKHHIKMIEWSHYNALFVNSGKSDMAWWEFN